MCCEGSVRKADNRVRISCQLIEAETGRRIWTERFDRPLADIFDLRDEISENIVGAVEPEILSAELRRARDPIISPRGPRAEIEDG